MADYDLHIEDGVCVIGGVLTLAANTALAANPLVEALKVAGAKPTLPVSAA